MQIFRVLKASEVFPVPDFVGPYSSLKPMTYVACTIFSFVPGSTNTRALKKNEHSSSVKKRNARTGEGE